MTQSQSISKIAPALLKAQQAMGGAKKDAQNPFFHSSYADLGAVMEACKDALNENGIFVLQPISAYQGESQAVETYLIHESGEFFSSKMKITPKNENNAQDVGSAVTYARRYALQSFLFIPAEDDDGNHASGKTTPKEPVDYASKRSTGVTYEPDTTPLPVKQPEVVQEALPDASSYSDWSKAKLTVEVSQHMRKGTITPDYANLNKKTKEELIALLESSNA